MVFSLCAALIPFLGRAQSPDSVAPAPDIRFETQKIDVGDTLYRKGTEYPYHFVYENTGTAPLIVNEVIAACPCLRIEFSTDPLPPGASDTLRVYFTPNHASKYTQRMTVFTNAVDGIQLFAKGNFLKKSEWDALQQRKKDSK